MAIQEGFENLKPEKPKRSDNFTPHVHFSEEEIQAMIASGMTEEDIIKKQVDAINNLAKDQLDRENKKK